MGVFSVPMTKHRNQGNQEKEVFNWTLVFQRVRVHGGGATAGQENQERKRERERERERERLTPNE